MNMTTSKFLAQIALLSVTTLALAAMFVCPIASADWADSLGEGSGVSREATVSSDRPVAAQDNAAASSPVAVESMRESVAATVAGGSMGSSFDFKAATERVFTPGGITVNTVAACDDPDDCGGDDLVD